MQIQNYFVAIVQLVFCMSHDAGVGENGRKKENRPCPHPVLYTVAIKATFNNMNFTFWVARAEMKMSSILLKYISYI